MAVEMAHTGRPIPSSAPRPRRTRPNVLLTGTALAAAGSITFFACLLGIYLAERAEVLASGDTWIPEGSIIPLTPANIAMVTLLMSAVTVQWAVYAIKNDDRSGSYVAMGVSMLLAFAFVNEMIVLISRMDLVLADSIPATLIYTITGAHLAMVGVALIYLVVMAFRALGGQYSREDDEGLQAAAIYWYATTAVFAVIWYAIYVTK